MLPEILMTIQLSMNKDYNGGGVVYDVEVTKIDKSGFHGYYGFVLHNGEYWQSQGIGLFRWEFINHMKKVEL